MTLKIIGVGVPTELIVVVQAEYNEELGTAVIHIHSLVTVSVLEPFVDEHRCDDPSHGVKTERYFEAKDIKQHVTAPPRLEGTLLGPDGSADFILYF